MRFPLAINKPLIFFFKQRLLDTLDKDEDKQRKRLGEMTRKITVLRVNEKSLSRRYTAMQEVEAALRKENKKYRNDVVAMETAITERLGYLQRHKVFFQFFNFFYFPFFSDFFFLLDIFFVSGLMNAKTSRSSPWSITGQLRSSPNELFN